MRTWTEFDDNMNPETWALVAMRLTGVGKDFSKEPNAGVVASWYAAQSPEDQKAILKALDWSFSERAGDLDGANGSTYPVYRRWATDSGWVWVQAAEGWKTRCEKAERELRDAVAKVNMDWLARLTEEPPEQFDAAPHNGYQPGPWWVFTVEHPRFGTLKFVRLGCAKSWQSIAEQHGTDLTAARKRIGELEADLKPKVVGTFPGAYTVLSTAEVVQFAGTVKWVPIGWAEEWRKKCSELESAERPVREKRWAEYPSAGGEVVPYPNGEGHWGIRRVGGVSAVSIEATYGWRNEANRLHRLAASESARADAEKQRAEHLSHELEIEHDRLQTTESEVSRLTAEVARLRSELAEVRREADELRALQTDDCIRAANAEAESDRLRGELSKCEELNLRLGAKLAAETCDCAAGPWVDGSIMPTTPGDYVVELPDRHHYSWSVWPTGSLPNGWGYTDRPLRYAPLRPPPARESEHRNCPSCRGSGTLLDVSGDRENRCPQCAAARPPEPAGKLPKPLPPDTVCVGPASCAGPHCEGCEHLRKVESSAPVARVEAVEVGPAGYTVTTTVNGALYCCLRLARRVCTLESTLNRLIALVEARGKVE